MRIEPVAVQDEHMVAMVTTERARCTTGSCDRACETGDAKACALVAELAWDGGYGHAFDPAAALRYAQRGCNGHDALACALLGRHHANGVATPWAPAAAVAAFEVACQGGAGLGCLELGTMYARGHGVDADPGKAAAYFARAKRAFRAACDGNEPRWCTSADRTEDGDVPDATARRACTRGVAASCVDVLIHRIGPGTGLIAEELDTLDRMCIAGERYACSTFARHLFRTGRMADQAKIVALVTRACELGEPQACMAVGMLDAATSNGTVAEATKRGQLERACDRALGAACQSLAQDAFVTGAADRVAIYAQRACELGEAGGCTMMTRHQLDQHDEAGADRWAREGCRRGARDDCKRLVDRDLELPSMPGGEQQRLYQSACLRGQAAECQRLAAIERAEAPVLAALLDVVTRRDVAGFARLTGTVKLRGLWFESADCTAQFARDPTRSAPPAGSARDDVLAESARPALLECFASHGLRLEAHAALDGSAALVYDPGIVLDITGGQIHQIVVARPWMARHDAAPVDAATLRSHLVAGSPATEPDPDTRAANRHLQALCGRGR
ncbi:MAG TPA: hypothetical protein VH165_30415 [Kofleriaceae bacterium]|nr:hypothetical protein [Kofleriaceae bacterium]